MKYSGNIQADMYDKNVRGKGAPHQDRYICTLCACMVYEDRYDHSRKVCVECLADEGK